MVELEVPSIDPSKEIQIILSRDAGGGGGASFGISVKDFLIDGRCS